MHQPKPHQPSSQRQGGVAEISLSVEGKRHCILKAKSNVSICLDMKENSEKNDLQRDVVKHSEMKAAQINVPG